jgi:hypothetical protein
MTRGGGQEPSRERVAALTPHAGDRGRSAEPGRPPFFSGRASGHAPPCSRRCRQRRERARRRRSGTSLSLGRSSRRPRSSAGRRPGTEESVGSSSSIAARAPGPWSRCEVIHRPREEGRLDQMRVERKRQGPDEARRKRQLVPGNESTWEVIGRAIMTVRLLDGVSQRALAAASELRGGSWRLTSRTRSVSHAPPSERSSRL